MKYAQHRSNMGKRSRPVPWKFIGILVAVIVILLVALFVFSGSDEAEEIEQGVVEVLEQDDMTVEVIQRENDEVNDEVGEVVVTYEEIDLVVVDGSGSSGIARRGYEDGLFTHVVVATLPSIDTESYFFEGWFVKPGVLDFFSTGEMFVREDGKWGLVWEVDTLNAPDDLDEYTQVVITLEPRDNDPAPAAHHVLEGEF